MGKVKSEMFKEELGFDDCLQLLDSLTVYETPQKLAKRYLENDLPPDARWRSSNDGLDLVTALAY